MALNRVVLVAQASFGDARGSYGGLGSYQIDLPRYARARAWKYSFMRTRTASGRILVNCTARTARSSPAATNFPIA